MSDSIKNGFAIAKRIYHKMTENADANGFDVYDLLGTRMWSYAVIEACHCLQLDSDEWDDLARYVIDNLEEGMALQDLWDHDLSECLELVIEVNMTELEESNDV